MPVPRTARHLGSILVLPGPVTLAVPAVLLWLTDGGSGTTLPGWAGIGLAAVGGVSLTFGLVLMGSTVALFARVGRGTLAPWDPTTSSWSRGRSATCATR